MYIIHEDVEGFLQVVRQSTAGTVYVQDTSIVVEPTARVLRTGLYLTTPGHEGDVVHAAHIRIESAALFQCQQSEDVVRQAMMQRMQDARACVHDALTGLPCVTRSGMALVPGLLEDIKRFQCAHTLWTWEGDVRDPMNRRLIPASIEVIS